MPVAFRHNTRETQEELNKLRRGLRGKALAAAAFAIGNQGVKELSKVAPRSKDGITEGKHLNKSFSYKISTRYVVRLISDRVYALMINRGTKPSVGGYVKVLDARLKKRTTRSRKLVSQKLKQHPGVTGTKYIEKAAQQLSLKATRVVMEELRRRGLLRRGKFVIPKS